MESTVVTLTAEPRRARVRGVPGTLLDPPPATSFRPHAEPASRHRVLSPILQRNQPRPGGVKALAGGGHVASR